MIRVTLYETINIWFLRLTNLIRFKLTLTELGVASQQTLSRTSGVKQLFMRRELFSARNF